MRRESKVKTGSAADRRGTTHSDNRLVRLAIEAGSVPLSELALRSLRVAKVRAYQAQGNSRDWRHAQKLEPRERAEAGRHCPHQIVCSEGAGRGSVSMMTRHSRRKVRAAADAQRGQGASAVALHSVHAAVAARVALRSVKPPGGARPSRSGGASEDVAKNGARRVHLCTSKAAHATHEQQECRQQVHTPHVVGGGASGDALGRPARTYRVRGWQGMAGQRLVRRRKHTPSVAASAEERARASLRGVGAARCLNLASRAGSRTEATPPQRARTSHLQRRT